MENLTGNSSKSKTIRFMMLSFSLVVEPFEVVVIVITNYAITFPTSILLLLQLMQSTVDFVLDHYIAM